MNTTPFETALYGAAELFGLDPLTTLDPVQAAAFGRSITRAVRDAWMKFPWAELTVTEQRFFRPDFDFDADYDEGDEVFDPDAGQYFISLDAGNRGHYTSDDVWWAPAAALSRYVLFDEPGCPRIGTIFAVTRTEDGPELPHDIASDRIRFYDTRCKSGFDSVWIKYRIQPSVFTTVFYDPAKTYTYNERVYDAVTGECYRALQSTHGNAPESLGDNWEVIPLPEIFADYATQYAYSDALKTDGQSDKAALERSYADELLIDRMEQDAIQTRQTAGFAFSRC